MVDSRIVKLTVFLLMMQFFTNTLQAEDKIDWPFVCFKPVFICDDSQLVGGSGYQIYNLLWKEMPDHEHTLVNMPIKRVIENAKQGNKQLFYGLYKTVEREKNFYFSLPCRISTPTYLVIRKSELPQFGNGKPVSLKRLLDDKSLTFLYLEEVSFGKGIDEILNQYKKQSHILTEYNTANPIQKSLKLLSNSRIDYMLSMDGTPHDAELMGLSHQIAYIPIKEQNHYDIGYVVAPKNDWGKEKINQVNEILRRHIPTESFFQFFTPLVDKSMVPQLREQFNKHILTTVNPPVHIATIQDNPIHEIAKAILKEAYGRIGHSVHFTPFPGIRSLNMANKGEVDGDAARIMGTEKSFSNLIPLPTPLMSFEAYAFSKNPNLKVTKWSDLKGLRIGIVRGIRYAEIGTRGLAPFYAENTNHLFKLLAQGRIQVAVATKRAGQVEINLNHKEHGIQLVGAPLYSAPLYHFVNKDKAHFIPLLDKVLQQMKYNDESLNISESTLKKMLTMKDHVEN